MHISINMKKDYEHYTLKSPTKHTAHVQFQFFPFNKQHTSHCRSLAQSYQFSQLHNSCLLTYTISLWVCSSINMRIHQCLAGNGTLRIFEKKKKNRTNIIGMLSSADIPIPSSCLICKEFNRIPAQSSCLISSLYTDTFVQESRDSET